MQDEPTVPYGFCHCGCGEKTKLAATTANDRGHVKGEPLRYVHGHHKRKGPRYVEEDRGYETPCWVWQWHKDPGGYGRGWFNGKPGTAHRAFYKALVGPIPEGLHIDHLCRVRACVNPEHMEPVTMLVNHRRGALTRITEDDVIELRSSRESASSVAARLGVTAAHVRDIRRRKCWKSVA